MTGLGIGGGTIDNWDLGVADSTGLLAPTYSILQTTTGTTAGPGNLVVSDPGVAVTYDTSVSFQVWRTNPAFIGAILVAVEVPPTLMGNYHLDRDLPGPERGRGLEGDPGWRHPERAGHRHRRPAASQLAPGTTSARTRKVRSPQGRRNGRWRRRRIAPAALARHPRQLQPGQRQQRSARTGTRSSSSGRRPSGSTATRPPHRSFPARRTGRTTPSEPSRVRRSPSPMDRRAARASSSRSVVARPRSRSATSGCSTRRRVAVGSSSRRRPTRVSTNTTTGTLPSGAFAIGDTLSAVANVDGSVDVWRTTAANVTSYLGRTTAAPAFTGTGRIGIQLPRGGARRQLRRRDGSLTDRRARVGGTPPTLRSPVPPLPRSRATESKGDAS